MKKDRNLELFILLLIFFGLMLIWGYEVKQFQQDNSNMEWLRILIGQALAGILLMITGKARPNDPLPNGNGNGNGAKPPEIKP